KNQVGATNACEEEILRLTGYKPRKKYKHYQEYLICLLRELHNLPYDKFTYLVSNQTYEWYKDAGKAFKLYKMLPQLPEVAKRNCVTLVMMRTMFHQKRPKLPLRSTGQTSKNS